MSAATTPTQRVERIQREIEGVASQYDVGSWEQLFLENIKPQRTLSPRQEAKLAEIVNGRFTIAPQWYQAPTIPAALVGLPVVPPRLDCSVPLHGHSIFRIDAAFYRPLSFRHRPPPRRQSRIPLPEDWQMIQRCVPHRLVLWQDTLLKDGSRKKAGGLGRRSLRYIIGC